MKMRWLLLLLLMYRRTVAEGCPAKCVCQFRRLSCSNLHQQDLNDLMHLLSNSRWADLRQLAINRSPQLDLKSLPQLEQLEELDISYNQLKETWEIEQKFRSLRKLNIEHNYLTNLSRTLLAPFPAIEEFYAGFNQFSKIGFDSLRMPRMRIIHINDNKITSIPFHTLRFMPYLTDINFSGNEIDRLMTSAFSLVGSLGSINLSRNRISRIECDTAQSLPALEMLDLSENNISSLPYNELKDFSGLRILNFSGNPIEIIGDHYTHLETLKVLDVSSSSLRIIQAGAFSSFTDLHTLFLRNNAYLVYLSPNTFENKSLFSLDVSGSGLTIISPKIFHQVAQIKIEKNPLDCGCLAEEMAELGSATIQDWDSATCRTRSGQTIRISELSASTLSKSDRCRSDVIVPFGPVISAAVGQSVSLYCAGTREDDIVSWKTPSGDVVVGKLPENFVSPPPLDYFTSTLFDPQTAVQRKQRISASTEFYKIDVVLQDDEGIYTCLVKRGDRTVSRKVELKVEKPSIKLAVADVGVTTVHVTWTMNLNVQASDRVSLVMESRSDDVEHQRTVQLPLQSYYCSYNVINLIPDTNYTICLRWALADDGREILGVCVRERTHKIRGFLDDMNPTMLIVVISIIVLFLLYVCFSKIWKRLHIYSTAKKQSKIIQSVSGQSILTQSITSDSTTYENHQLETCSSRSLQDAGPLLESMAV